MRARDRALLEHVQVIEEGRHDQLMALDGGYAYATGEQLCLINNCLTV